VIVVDASALLDAVLESRTDGVLDSIAAAEETLHAPQLLDLEVVSGLRRLSRNGQLPLAQAESCLRTFRMIRIRRHSHEPLLRRIWELRSSLSAYDAAYVALAELLGCTLLTANARLARSAGHQATIRLVS
jgi:predicted nucleic acid-binding protein